MLEQQSDTLTMTAYHSIYSSTEMSIEYPSQLQVTCCFAYAFG